MSHPPAIRTDNWSQKDALFFGMAGLRAFFTSDDGSLRKSGIFNDVVMGGWWCRSGKRGNFDRFNRAVSKVVSESVSTYANVWVSPITVFVSFSWKNSLRGEYGDGINVDGISR